MKTTNKITIKISGRSRKSIPLMFRFPDGRIETSRADAKECYSDEQDFKLRCPIPLAQFIVIDIIATERK